MKFRSPCSSLVLRSAHMRLGRGLVCKPPTAALVALVALPGLSPRKRPIPIPQMALYCGCGGIPTLQGASCGVLIKSRLRLVKKGLQLCTTQPLRVGPRISKRGSTIFCLREPCQ